MGNLQYLTRNIDTGKRPPILSKRLTAFAKAQGIKGEVYIVDHLYYLFEKDIRFHDAKDHRRKIGFSVEAAESYLVRQAAKRPIHTLEVEPGPVADPEQTSMITTAGEQLSLI